MRRQPLPEPAQSPTGIVVSDALLRAWPLPQPGRNGDKETRGQVLVVGGSREMPGAVILAACAALRAGAGKVTIATAASVASLVAVAVPEARVLALPEEPDGSLIAEAGATLAAVGARSDAVLIGPGMQDEANSCALVQALLPHLGAAPIVLDAYAMGLVHHSASTEQEYTGSAMADGGFVEAYAGRILLTPHAGEMAHLSGQQKDGVAEDAGTLALQAAVRWRAMLALKGATTWIATPDGELWRHTGGNAGLAISGSGDVLAGIIVGLAARGASLQQAAVWGVALHARAGERLAASVGPLGYLAREMAAEVPRLMQQLGGSDREPGTSR